MSWALSASAEGKGQQRLVLEPGAGDEGERGPGTVGPPGSAELLTCSCWEGWDDTLTGCIHFDTVHRMAGHTMSSHHVGRLLGEKLQTKDGMRS